MVLLQRGCGGWSAAQPGCPAAAPQVEDIIRKEQGKYLRSAAARFVQHGYQIRVGHMYAGEYGCPQVSLGFWVLGE